MWARVIVIGGVTAMLVGAVDPLEGCAVVLLGVALAAFGAALGRSRYRTLLVGALALTAMGVVAMVALSWAGGIGGQSGHSMWWAALIVPYPLGWLLALVGAALILTDSLRRPAARRRAMR
jgi:hypothetical protein